MSSEVEREAISLIAALVDALETPVVRLDSAESRPIPAALPKARSFLDRMASHPDEERRMIDPEQLRAMVTFLGPEEMTPTAERHLLSLCEGEPRCPRDTNGDGDCGRRYCPVCGEGSS